MEEITINCHSSIRIENSKIIYFDPFHIEKNPKDADIIFITHSHYDHFSEEDILKVKKEETDIYVPTDLLEESIQLGFDKSHVYIVEPNQTYSVDSIISITTIPAYNTNKSFHPKENEWIGYLLHIESKTYYIAGDTDITEENKQVKCDIALVPIGGTYTMTAEEAAKLINSIQPKIAIPTHYGEIVGTLEDESIFKKHLLPGITCKTFIHEIKK